MKLLYPDYYPSFHCLASACHDNCCLGWEIDIDPDAYANYIAQPGAFGEKLRANIQADPTPHFRLCGKDERCPFLNAQNLCEIHIRLGEQALCRICTMHPRFAEQFGDFAEIGLGLACESAARLILSRSQPMQLIESKGTAPFEEQQPFEPALRTGVFHARKHLMLLLQQRTLPVSQRLLQALLYGQELQALLETGTSLDSFCQICAQEPPAEYPLPLVYFNPCETLCALLNTFLQMEYLDSHWNAELSACAQWLSQCSPAQLCALQPPAESWCVLLYEQFCVYLLFRYFAKASFDWDLLGKLQLIAAAFSLLYLLQIHSVHIGESWDFSKACHIAKSFSKEVEYSEENMELLQQALTEQPLLTPLRLCLLLSALHI